MSVLPLLRLRLDWRIQAGCEEEKQTHTRERDRIGERRELCACVCVEISSDDITQFRTGAPKCFIYGNILLRYEIFLET